MKKSRAYFIGSREQKSLLSELSTNPTVRSACNDIANQVKSEAMDNISVGYSMTASKGSGLQQKFTEELDVMSNTLDAFSAKDFFRKKVVALRGTRIPVAIVSYGTDPDSQGPVYGSLWEFGISGVSSISRPRLAALERAWRSVGRGT